MAKLGRPAKPVELKVLEGNRGHRAIGVTDGSFRPEVGMPTMPKGLSPGARKVWRRLGPELLRYNLMSAVFVDIFEDLCESISDVKMLRHALRRRQALLVEQGKDPADAFETRAANGTPMQAAIYHTLRAERQEMHRLLGKFGLSPAEQASVTQCVRAQLKLFDQPKVAAGDGLPGGFNEF